MAQSIERLEKRLHTIDHVCPHLRSNANFLLDYSVPCQSMASHKPKQSILHLFRLIIYPMYSMIKIKDVFHGLQTTERGLLSQIA